jgi:hypothetical protein
MRGTCRWYWTWSLMLGLLGMSTPVRAEPTAAERAAAEALFEEGLGLLEKREFTGACSKLEASQKLDPGVGTLLYLADCYEQAGRSASAWATFKEAAYAAERQGQTERQQIAERNADRLKPLLSYLELSLTEPIARGTTITLNGSPVSDAQLQGAIPVDPGDHQLVVSAPEHVTWSAGVTIPPGARTNKTQVPALVRAPTSGSSPAEPSSQAPVSAAPPASAPPETDRGTAPERSGASQRTWAYVLGGAGIAGLGVAGVFSLVARSRDQQADGECDPTDPRFCTQQGVQLAQGADRAATIATWTAVAGGALLGTGVALWLTAPKPKAPPQAALLVGPVARPGSGMLVVKGAW